MTTPTMAERIQEAHDLVRRLVGTDHEAAALAYLAAQVDLARRSSRMSSNGGALQARGKR